MPGPQSTAFFLLLLAVFAVAIWRALVARKLVFRLLAAGLAFLPAMLFGVAAVNKYYDYYQTWGAAYGDLTNQGAPLQVAEAPGGSRTGLARLLGSHVDTSLAQQDGFTLRLKVPGPLSHITRTVWVYLPPQYFQAPYAHYRFPVMELLHGFPGVPRDWISLLGITGTLREEIAVGRAKPAVLIMPDVNGTRGVSLQCLNQLNGPQDATYLARDLPEAMTRVLRVQPPGPAWGIAGYSEGGFCAADLGLRYGRSYGFAGVLSGYFVPFDNQVGNPPELVSPYGKDQRLRREDTPEDLVTSLPAGARVPQFWLGAGAGSRLDSTNARVFAQMLQVRQGTVTVHLVKGGQLTTGPGTAPGSTTPGSTTTGTPAGRRPSPAPAPGRAGPGAGAARPAGPGARRPRGTARPATGRRAGTGPRRTWSPRPGPAADPARSSW